MAGKKTRRQLHKNAASNIVQVLEATPHKASTIVPNVIKMIGLITITAPNAFPDSLFIISIRAHAVFENFTDRE